MQKVKIKGHSVQKLVKADRWSEAIALSPALTRQQLHYALMLLPHLCESLLRTFPFHRGFRDSAKPWHALVY